MSFRAQEQHQAGEKDAPNLRSGPSVHHLDKLVLPDLIDLLYCVPRFCLCSTEKESHLRKVVKPFMLALNSYKGKQYPDALLDRISHTLVEIFELYRTGDLSLEQAEHDIDNFRYYIRKDIEKANMIAANRVMDAAVAAVAATAAAAEAEVEEAAETAAEATTAEATAAAEATKAAEATAAAEAAKAAEAIAVAAAAEATAAEAIAVAAEATAAEAIAAAAAAEAIAAKATAAEAIATAAAEATALFASITTQLNKQPTPVRYTMAERIAAAHCTTSSSSARCSAPQDLAPVAAQIKKVRFNPQPNEWILVGTEKDAAALEAATTAAQATAAAEAAKAAEAIAAAAAAEATAAEATAAEAIAAAAAAEATAVEAIAAAATEAPTEAAALKPAATAKLLVATQSKKVQFNPQPNEWILVGTEKDAAALEAATIAALEAAATTAALEAPAAAKPAVAKAADIDAPGPKKRWGDDEPSASTSGTTLKWMPKQVAETKAAEAKADAEAKAALKKAEEKDRSIPTEAQVPKSKGQWASGPPVSNVPTVPSTTQPSEFRFKPLSKPGSGESKVQTSQSRQNRVQVLSPSSNPQANSNVACVATVWCDLIPTFHRKYTGRESLTDQEMSENHFMSSIPAFLEAGFERVDPNIKVSEILHVSPAKEANAYVIVFTVKGGWKSTELVRDCCPKQERENKAKKGCKCQWWQVGSSWEKINFLFSQNVNTQSPDTDLYHPAILAKEVMDIQASVAVEEAEKAVQVRLAAAKKAKEDCLVAAEKAAAEKVAAEKTAADEEDAKKARLAGDWDTFSEESVLSNSSVVC